MSTMAAMAVSGADIVIVKSPSAELKQAPRHDKASTSRIVSIADHRATLPSPHEPPSRELVTRLVVRTRFATLWPRLVSSV